MRSYYADYSRGKRLVLGCWAGMYFVRSLYPSRNNTMNPNVRGKRVSDLTSIQKWTTPAIAAR
jgi:hypothetical protein